MGSSNSIRNVQNQSMGGDLPKDMLNPPPKCTVAIGSCVLSFLLASFLGSHVIQIMSLKFFPQFYQCSLIIMWVS